MGNVSRGLVVALVLTALSACRHEPDETRIRNAIADMTAALEQRDSGRFLSHVAPTYQDPEGRDFRQLRALLTGSLLRYPKIRVLVSGTAIDVRGDQAQVRLVAYMTSGETLVADRELGSYRVNAGWRRLKGEWAMITAQWEPAIRSE